jgi:hypothetical protein
MDEKLYSDFVNEQFEAAASGSPVVFSNRGSEHARIVLRKLIQTTSRTLDIFTGSLTHSVYDPGDIRAVCARRAKVRVIIGDELPFGEESALSSLTPEIERGVIEVCKVIRLDANQPHFIISDGENLRAELDHGAKTAVVILNASALNVGHDYAARFDSLHKNSRPLSEAERRQLTPTYVYA